MSSRITLNGVSDLSYPVWLNRDHQVFNSSLPPSASGYLSLGDFRTKDSSVFHLDRNTVQQGAQLERLQLGDNLNRITPKQIFNEDTMFVISDCERPWDGKLAPF